MYRRSVHPHVRGDDRLTRRSWSIAQGCSSPPRAWGRSPMAAIAVVYALGGPPRTCVGTMGCTLPGPAQVVTVHPHVRGDDNRLSALRTSSSASVHPHVRGDDDLPSTALSAKAAIDGSLPRAWGRLLSRKACPLARRFTPHVRGDDILEQKIAVYDTGSPSRAWGRFPWRGPWSRRRRSPHAWGTISPPPGVRGRRAVVPVHPHVRGGRCSARRPFGTALDIGGSPPRAWGRF